MMCLSASGCWPAWDARVMGEHALLPTIAAQPFQAQSVHLMGLNPSVFTDDCYG